MKRLVTAVSALSIVLFVAASARAETLAEMFNRVKTDFSQGDYKRTLADVEALDIASQKPGMEKDRAKLLAPIAFYRAASLAGLNRADDAREAFVTFLIYSPNASITSPPFPKPVVDAFSKAQKEAAGRSNGLAIRYLQFSPPAGWTIPADAQWIASPVRYLLTADEKKQYAALTTPADREAFIEQFWKSLDATPDTPENEFRTEFERRVAFADANFGTEKMAGRETDRALIFTFLGIPTYVGASNISADSDAIASLRSGGSSSGSARAAGNQSKGFGALTGSGTDDALEAPYQRGTREVWYYRRGRIPAGVPYQEVKFEFITKEGYGSNVLQKESSVLQTLGVAAENARKNRKLN